MTEGEKERIKHRAAFYNGCGVAVLAGMALGASARVASQPGGPLGGEPDTVMTLAVSTGYIVFGVFVAFMMHNFGQAVLRKLD